MKDQICKVCNNKNSCNLKEVNDVLDHQILNCKDFKVNHNVMFKD